MAPQLCLAHGGERQRRLPGDELVPQPAGMITHAITIDAPRAAIWPWLVQMGSGRAGWYAYDHIDNGGTPSARRIVAELQHVAAGDVMPWLPGARDGFIVGDVVPEQALVLGVPLQSASKTSPPALRASWTLVLEPLGQERTRLLARSRIARNWLAPQINAPAAPKQPAAIERVYALLAQLPGPLMLLIARFGHYLMESRMLRGIKRRAEQSGTQGRIKSSVPSIRVLHAINPTVTALLRSPLHGLLSGSTCLLSFTGRRTGKRLTIPVGYTRYGDTLTIFSSRSWWKNLRGGASVEVLLQGRRYRGWAVATDSPEAVMSAVEQTIASYGRKAAGWKIGIRLDTSPPPTQEQIAAAMHGRVVIHIRLAGALADQGALVPACGPSGAGPEYNAGAAAARSGARLPRC